MKTHPLFPFIRRLAASLFAFSILRATTTQAGLQVPYTPDADTLHLWHFDDATNNQGTANFVTVTDAVATAGITLTNYGLGTSSTNTGAAISGTPPFTNIFLVTQSATANLNGSLNILPGGGAAGKAYAFCGTSNNIGGYFADTTPFRNPTSGAFTFEALVYIQGPVFSTTIGNEWELFCGDSQGESGGRSWQFRMQPGATPSLNVNFITAAGGTSPNFSPLLPTAGPNALSVSNWYHVALTFTGNAPTNGDPAGVLRFYWTYFDPFRTNADVLASFTNSGFGTLGGGPIPAIGGSARRNNGVGNAGAFEGFIDEVRISAIARRAGEMAFISGGPQNPPSFVSQPAANTLVGFGKILSLSTLVSGTIPIFYQWQGTNSGAGGWTNVPGQTDSTLLFNPVNFAQAGTYRLIATNSIGGSTSQVARVTVGASFAELFNTGFDTNGFYEPTNLPNNPDPHYQLIQSADVNNLGPRAIVWNMFTYPIAAFGGFFANEDGASQWIGPQANNYNSPAGQYIYRTTFLLDSVDLAQPARLQGTWWVGNVGTDIRLNGVSTGITAPANQQNTGSGFVITNGFKSGLNTLDFVIPIQNPNAWLESAVRTELSGVGQALPPGLPVITNQPANQTVRDAGATGPGAVASFSVVALGRPPLSYQWWADGAPVSGATGRTLTFESPATGAQGTNFTVVISNSSGSVTSAVAVLTLVSTNQPPLAPAYNFTLYQDNTLDLNVSTLYHAASDPDGDAFNITVDSFSTNGGSITPNGILVTYTPIAAYTGADQFNYTITDALSASTQSPINLTILPLQSPTVTSLSVTGSNVLINGQGGAAGGGFSVIASTDLSIPLASWTVVGAGTFGISGNFSISIPIPPATPHTYYSIRVP